MKIALNAQQLAGTHALPEILELAESHGVKSVELWPANLEGGGTPEENERFERRDVAGAARLLRARGFEVAAVTLGGDAAPLCWAAGGGVRYAEALRGAVDAALALGARRVNTYNKGRPLAEWSAAVRPAADYAASRGVVITLENEAHDESARPENVAAAIERIGSPGVGTLFDPCNYYHAYVEPFPTAYQKVWQHIRYVHLKGGCQYDDSLPGVHRGSVMRDRTHEHIGYLPLPAAAFNVEAIIQALSRDGYDGWLTLEPHVPVGDLDRYYAIEVSYVKQLLARHARL